MQENAGKMRIRITPNTDTFYAVTVNLVSQVNCLNQGRFISDGMGAI